MAQSQALVITSQAQLLEAFGIGSVYLASGTTLKISRSVTIGPNVVFDGECSFGEACRIDSGCIITNAKFGQNNVIRSHSVISDFAAGDNNILGPFCFLRDNCVVDSDAILGAHVEAARSTFASGVKISHRAFVGDARVGARTIIGAGTVFCNFDGNSRQSTTIGNDVTIGSGTMLVAPLTVGDNVVVGAGSVVTNSVGPNVRILQKRETIKLPGAQP
jgi:bifunctional UDP-N-acetylglucosamine pyrophosphorylase/glucosamine-1-phosphate N-acetyltransferase